jgi:hypothetical protein
MKSSRYFPKEEKNRIFANLQTSTLKKIFPKTPNHSSNKNN